MNRLLTDDEIQQIVCPWWGKLSEKEPRFVIEKEVAKAQRALTLREVEEWLGNMTHLTAEGDYWTALGIYHEFEKDFGLEKETNGS